MALVSVCAGHIAILTAAQAVLRRFTCSEVGEKFFVCGLKVLLRGLYAIIDLVDVALEIGYKLLLVGVHFCSGYIVIHAGLQVKRGSNGQDRKEYFAFHDFCVLEIKFEIQTIGTGRREVENLESTEAVTVRERDVGINGSVLVDKEEVTSDERYREVLAVAEEVAERVTERKFAEAEVGGIVNVIGRIVLTNRFIPCLNGNNLSAAVGHVHTELAVVGIDAVVLCIHAGVGCALRLSKSIEFAFGHRYHLTADTAVDEEVEREVLKVERIRPTELELGVHVADILAVRIALRIGECSVTINVALATIDSRFAFFVYVDISSAMNLCGR